MINIQDSVPLFFMAIEIVHLRGHEGSSMGLAVVRCCQACWGEHGPKIVALDESGWHKRIPRYAKILTQPANEFIVTHAQREGQTNGSRTVGGTLMSVSEPHVMSLRDLPLVS